MWARDGTHSGPRTPKTRIHRFLLRIIARGGEKERRKKNAEKQRRSENTEKHDIHCTETKKPEISGESRTNCKVTWFFGLLLTVPGGFCSAV